jgi:hypothetical protein
MDIHDDFKSPDIFPGTFLCTRARNEFCCLAAARARRSEQEEILLPDFK